MQDKIKFQIENLRMDDHILETKFIKGSKLSRYGNEVFLFNYHKSIFKKKLIQNDINNKTDESNYLEDSKNQNMYVLFIRKEGESSGKLIFKQNIRKNWILYTRLQSNELQNDEKYPSVMHDLQYSDFVEIIEVWANELQIPKNIFWSGKVTQIELGVNLMFKTKTKINSGFERLSLNKILSCFGSYKNVEDKYMYGENGVCFRAQNFELSVYNKLRRVVYNNEIFTCNSDSSKKAMCEKINQVAYFMRYELRIKKVSGFNQSAFSGKIETLKQIKDNWNLLAKALFNTTEDLTFDDVLSPEIEHDLLVAGLESKSKKIFKDFLIYSGVKLLGFDTFRTYFLPLVSSKVKSSFEKEIRRNFSAFRNRQKYKYSYEKRFLSALDKKLKSLQVS